LLKTALAGCAAPPLLGCEDGGGAIAGEAVDGESTLFTGAGGNVFATSTGDGVLLVDTGLAESARALLKAVSRRYQGDRPVAAFNTHWHYDHAGGDAMVREMGARIYAHENTRLWLGGDFYVPWEDRHYTPLPEAALPTDTFYVSGETTIGGRDIAYVHLPRAHTDGDIYVHLRDADIIVAGDLVSVGAYPMLDWYTGGWIGAHAQATEALLEASGPNTRIVPGKGPVVGRDHLEKQHEMLVAVRDRIFAAVRQGKSAREMLEARVTEGFDEEWGDPTQFVMNTYPGLWAHSYEVGQVV
jgi:glyoxylase-like metal-dependent hydrolase (beta-lactamase superfamily II)